MYIGTNSILKDLLHLSHSKDTIVLPYIETESFLEKNLHYLEKNGYAFATIKLINIQKKGSDLFASLEFKIQSQRKLNSILIKYDKPELIKDFHKGYLTQMNHKYRNKIFNQKLLTEIHADFEKCSFVTQIKYPEILFTKDTTKVYLYLQKTKTNTFDGFIEFNNDNKKNNFQRLLKPKSSKPIKSGRAIFS